MVLRGLAGAGWTWLGSWLNGDYMRRHLINECRAESDRLRSAGKTEAAR
jgi:hypothetical protein